MVWRACLGAATCARIYGKMPKKVSERIPMTLRLTLNSVLE